MDENINKKFNKLTVLRYDHTGKFYEKYYLFKCECGNEKIINFQNVRSGKTKSCGCNYKDVLSKLKKKENKYMFRKKYIIGYTTNSSNKFYIDKEDYEKIKNISWYETKNGYICHKDTNKKVIFLHRYIMNCPKDKIIDHINHNKKDNRKENLRIVGYKENALNRTKKPKGITKNIVGKKTYYIVQLNGCYRGNFKTYNEAKKLRDEILKKEYYLEEKIIYDKIY